MRKHYTPRRASLKRWLKKAPDYILDVLDVANCADHFVVFFGSKFAYYVDDAGVAHKGSDKFGNTHVSVLFMSDNPTDAQGVSIWDTMTASVAASYRYKQKHRRIKWTDLPENIRKHVIYRVTEE